MLGAGGSLPPKHNQEPRGCAGTPDVTLQGLLPGQWERGGARPKRSTRPPGDRKEEDCRERAEELGGRERTDRSRDPLTHFPP